MPAKRAYPVIYPALEAEIEKRGLEKKEMAARLGISYRSFFYKSTGKTDFTWREVETMGRVFFPDMKLEELMTRREG